MAEDTRGDPVAHRSGRKRSRWPIVFFIVVLAVLGWFTLSSRSISPDNAFWFSATIAQVSVTLVAIILLLLTYLASSGKLGAAPTLGRWLVSSALLFFGVVILALLNIAVIPSRVAGPLSLVDISSRILGPAVLFAAGVVLLYYATQDILEELPG